MHADVWKRWSFSLLLVPLYAATFLYWQWHPSRASFVLGGLMSASVMTATLVYAARRGYFVNRVDLFLHAYVVVDVLLEAFLFELFIRRATAWGIVSAQSSRALADLVHTFHASNNFYGCILAFCLLIGGHRWWMLTRRPADEGSSPST